MNVEIPFVAPSATESEMLPVKPLLDKVNVKGDVPEADNNLYVYAASQEAVLLSVVAKTPALAFIKPVNPVRVKPANAGVAPVWIFCGNDRVISPVDVGETVIWLAVPVKVLT